MSLKTIYLQNFRSFSKKEIIFEDTTTVIVGQNTTGKTNILEAIHLLATGRSFRANLEQEMVKRDEKLARVSGVVVSAEGEERGGKVNLEVVLTRGMLHGSKVPKKKFSINSSAKSFTTFVGNLKTVLFGPWDMDLVTGSPSNRRRVLDSVCSQTDREYRRSLLSYEKGLRQRNRVLQRIREGEAHPPQLLFWNSLLIKNGNYITQVRQEFIDFVNLTAPLNDEELRLEYDKSTISPARLEEYSQEEIAAGVTLVGPHRDDFGIRARSLSSGQAQSGEEWRNLSIYGSRGEQRMAVLWLKLAELTFLEGKTGEKPVLLLDDVFSELDQRHQNVVMQTIGKQQTIMTTADAHIAPELGGKAKIIEI